MQDRTYLFKNIDFCNMCGADKSKFKILGKRLNQSQGKTPKNKIGITINETTAIIMPKRLGFGISRKYSFLADSYNT